MKPKRKHPSATAFSVGLYTIPGVPPEGAQIMEKVFLSAVDSTAAEALSHLLSRTKTLDDIPQHYRMAWSRFLYSLILRTSEHMEWARTKLHELQYEVLEEQRPHYLSRRKSEDPETFAEFKRQFLANPDNISAARYLHRFVSNGLAVSHIMSMRWSLATFKAPQFPLLTSDRPIIMTNGLNKDNSHIALPISPTQIFLACNSVEVERSIQNLNERKIIEITNSRVVEQARKYVYGIDDSQLRFVKNRFGKKTPSTPLG